MRRFSVRKHAQQNKDWGRASSFPLKGVGSPERRQTTFVPQAVDQPHTKASRLDSRRNALTAVSSRLRGFV
jgi:hypothetical protein